MTGQNAPQWTEEALNQRLQQIHDRLKWISDEEARAAWVDGAAAKGIFMPERIRLIEETDRVLDELERINGFPKYQDKE